MSTLELLRPSAANAPTALVRSRSLMVEQLAYLALGVLALIAHMWGLDWRALHHDETLHASYSWFLLVGRGYIHDPLLHGPLLYFLGALGYFLFGDNDFTARLMPALAGTALTLTPYLLRRELGRPAALLAAVYLLISPVALYVGRFLRHDIYSVLCEMLVFAAIIRYATTRRTGWLITGAAAFGLMLVNQETSYLFLVMMAVPLVVVLLWQVYRPGIALVAVLGLAVIGLLFIAPGEAQVDGSHNAITDPSTGQMQVKQPGLFGWPPLATEDNGYALLIRNRADNSAGRLLESGVGYLRDLWRFFGHPAVLLSAGLLLSTLAALFWLIWRRPGRDGRTPWQVALDRRAPAAELFASLGHGQRFLLALATLLSIYLLFFTAFFTNLLGAITGITGSLLYWLAQHSVQRGGQPAHYYLFQLGVYEPLLLLFGLIGLVLLARDTFSMQQAKARSATTDEDAELSTVAAGQGGQQPSRFCIAFVAWWAVAALVVYAWAGEKMPWLTLHQVLPLTLLAAWAFQRLVWGAGVAGASRLPDRSALVTFAALFSAVIGLSMGLMTAIIGFGQDSFFLPWMVPLATLFVIALLTAGAALHVGWRPAVALLVVCVGTLLGLATFRAAVRLSYVNGDVPVEPMVYTQTSPDVLRIVRRIEAASLRRGHGLDLPIIYDNETVWSWYLRNFTKAQRNNGQLDTPPGPEVMAVFLLQENMDQHAQNQSMLRGFVVQRYPLRWWFPEDQSYRLNGNWREVPLEQASLLGQLLRNPFDRGVGERWWRFLMFRDPGYPLGSSDFVIAVRPELASQIGIGLGGKLVRQPDQ